MLHCNQHPSAHPRTRTQCPPAVANKTRHYHWHCPARSVITITIIIIGRQKSWADTSCPAWDALCARSTLLQSVLLGCHIPVQHRALQPCVMFRALRERPQLFRARSYTGRDSAVRDYWASIYYQSLFLCVHLKKAVGAARLLAA